MLPTKLVHLQVHRQKSTCTERLKARASPDKQVSDRTQAMDSAQSDADFKLSVAFDCIYAWLIDVVFVFQTVTFVLLFYVIFVLTR